MSFLDALSGVLLDGCSGLTWAVAGTPATSHTASVEARGKLLRVDIVAMPPLLKSSEGSCVGGAASSAPLEAPCAPHGVPAAPTSGLALPCACLSRAGSPACPRSGRPAAAGGWARRCRGLARARPSTLPVHRYADKRPEHRTSPQSTAPHRSLRFKACRRRSSARRVPAKSLRAAGAGGPTASQGRTTCKPSRSPEKG